MIIYYDEKRALIGLHAPLLTVSERDQLITLPFLEYNDGVTFYDATNAIINVSGVVLCNISEQWEIEK